MTPPESARRAGPSPARHWTLDPEIAFLNHGSFGACPAPVLEVQAELRARLEREPVHFYTREAPRLLATARERLADFVGVPIELISVGPDRDQTIVTPEVQAA